MRLRDRVGHVLLMVENELKTPVSMAWIESKGVLITQKYQKDDIPWLSY